MSRRRTIHEYDMIRCSGCGKEFMHNPHSIYKIKIGAHIKRYCSYSCWRKAGGDNGKPKDWAGV